MPGSIVCQRGDTVRGAVLRGVRTGVARVAAAGTVLTVSFSCSVLACAVRRVLGQTLASSPLVLAAEKAGPAIRSSNNKQMDDFIWIVPNTLVPLRCTCIAKGCKASAF